MRVGFGFLPNAEKSTSVLAYIQDLDRAEVDAIVHTIAEILYSNGAKWTLDLQWTSNQLEAIGVVLGDSGVYRAVEAHNGEKVFA